MPTLGVHIPAEKFADVKTAARFAGLKPSRYGAKAVLEKVRRDSARIKSAAPKRDRRAGI